VKSFLVTVRHFILLLIPFVAITAIMIPPSRPNITRLSDSSVMVRWGVPLNDGLPIQFFKVQYREMTRTGNGRRRGGGSGAHSRGPSQGKGSRWMTNNEDIPPHIRSYEVNGLETDHTYRYISVHSLVSFAGFGDYAQVYAVFTKGLSEIFNFHCKLI
jgi:hypothetical protein